MKTAAHVHGNAPAAVRRRRGVILLVVMGFLALLTTVAVTYVIASREFKMSARAATSAERFDDGFDQLLERAFRQLVRGSQNPYSAARIHSLLEDLYGHATAGGIVNGVNWNSAGGNLSVTVDVNATIPNLAPLKEIPHHYAGQVLTFTTGNLRNRSFRVIDYERDSGSNFRFRLLRVPLPGDTTAALVSPSVDDQLVVNGRPFNGTGFGFDPTTGNIESIALYPNAERGANIGTYNLTAGGANEDYDIPDYNNIHLAARVWNPDENRWEVQSPSFHNPALINWHRVQGHTDADQKRRFMFRPLTEDHPKFDGSNNWSLHLNSLARTDPDPILWDVDNDGDGLPDSIWIDLGMPVQISADGKYYKPLFAVMIQDLDSRLNLNTHGSDRHLAGRVPFYPDPSEVNPSFGSVESAPNVSSAPFPSAVANAWNNLIPGIGSGPAEVNPLGILGLEFNQLIYGIPSSGIVGRYGELDQGALESRFGDLRRAGWTDGQRDRSPAKRDDHRYNRDVYNPGNNRPWHSWADLDGDLGVLLTYVGLPLKAPVVQHGNFKVPPMIGLRDDISVDPDDEEHPYHLNPYRETFETLANRSEWVDAPFTMREAEVFLRPADIDSSTLPRRLRDLLPNTWNDAKKRGQVTAESYAISVPTCAPTPAMRSLMLSEGEVRPQLSFPELVFWKIKLEHHRHGDPVGDNTAWDLVNDLFNKGLFPEEVILGQKWNPTQMGLTHDQYARQLYMLAMLVHDVPSTYVAEYERTVAKRLAQWAINVVDFADDDQIMTGFEFDVHPYFADGGASTTWNVDNQIGTGDDSAGHRDLVWGVEEPQLLITETFACHDTRTEDLDGDDNPDPTQGGKVPDGRDDDFDQRRRPQGSVFLELFNPNLLRSVDLDAMTPEDPDSGRGPTPVWQILLLRGPAEYNNPAMHLDPMYPRLNDPDIRRVVWFVNHDPDLPALDRFGQIDPSLRTLAGNKARYTRLRKFDADTARPDYENPLEHNGDASHYAQLARNTFVVPAGGFTVIGPRVRTRFGYSGPGGTNSNLHTIRLIEQAGTTSWTPDEVVAYAQGQGLLDIERNAYWVNYPRQDYAHRDNDQIRRVKGIVINEPLPLNVSEPVGGYPNTVGTTPDPDDPDILYHDSYGTATQPFPDQPFAVEDGFPRDEQTIPLAYSVYLQRVANPTKPYHPERNPYLTVDFAPMDLHVFNGEADRNSLAMDPDQDASTHLVFQTRERWDDTGSFNIWKQSFAPLEPAAPPLEPEGDGNQRLPHQFRHSLGFLPGFRNKPGTMGNPNPNHWFARNGIWQEGEDFSAFNVRDENGNLVGGLNLLGFPKPPPWDQPSIANRNFNDTTPWFYPWLGWFNRPYMNPMELLQVPASSPSRFLREFDPNSDRDPYDAAVPPFVHLQNFFHTNTGSPQAPLAPRGLHRLFDFIETPSRFHGSKLFDAAGNAHPRFRDPGRVNINTIFDDGDTWAALFNLPLKNPELENHWRETWGSRQGFGDFEASGEVVVGRLRVNDNYPTFFRKPFRAFNHYGDTPYSSFNPSEEIHSTVFRKHPRPQVANDRPLLASRTVKEPETHSVFAANSPYFDGDRHPYFRYQPLARIANNYSTTSNVYAIWITVGYFEAKPVQRSDIHPDGFEYGRELGLDTGEAVRHRAFYIFDRSIPMGFVRGEDLNTEQGVLVRRIIE